MKNCFDVLIREIRLSERKMKFSEIKDYVLTPGAAIYAKLSGSGFCASPSEMIERIARFGDMESSVVEDFIYARIPLTKELAYSIDHAFSIIGASEVWEYWNNYQRKKDSGCRVFGIEFVLDNSVVIDEEVIESFKSEILELNGKWNEQLSKVKNLYRVLKEAQQLIRDLDCFSDGYYEEMEDAGAFLDERVKLLHILAFQKERKQTKDDLENTDGIWAKVSSLPYCDRKSLLWRVCSKLTHCWKLAVSLESLIETSFWGDCYYSQPIDVRLLRLYRSAVSDQLSSVEFDPEYVENTPSTRFQS